MHLLVICQRGTHGKEQDLILSVLAEDSMKMLTFRKYASNNVKLASEPLGGQRTSSPSHIGQVLFRHAES